nr:synaptotagmin-12-like isoform X2 [Halyomorpha halys]
MVLTTLLLVVGVSLVLLLLWARYKSFCADLARWIMSNTEEKVVLTRLKGHYNANGYLLDWGTGSFRRFESVDSESALEIPPQPLRPAPTTTPPPKPIPVDEVCVEMPEGGPMLKRAISCESVSSDSSVAAVDLVEPNVTGYLCIGIEYDSECGDLVVSVIEAKDLICKDYVSHNGLLDTFVTVYLLPTRTTDMQTRTYRSSRSPSYKEKFLFGLEVTDFCRSSLMFHVYSVRREENVLLGEAQLLLADVPTKQPITTWLTLLHSNMGAVRKSLFFRKKYTPSHRENSLGEILFSLSYLPTAERLTVVIVKARNLQFAGPSGDPYVKVYLLRNGKKVHKKKTQSKRNETCPIFNEAMIFSVPNNALQGLEVRVTVADSNGVIGHVIVGGNAAGKALSHWTQMLASLRKPVAMWHPLLQPQHLP